MDIYTKFVRCVESVFPMQVNQKVEQSWGKALFSLFFLLYTAVFCFSSTFVRLPYIQHFGPSWGLLGMALAL